MPGTMKTRRRSSAQHTTQTHSQGVWACLSRKLSVGQRPSAAAADCAPRASPNTENAATAIVRCTVRMATTAAVATHIIRTATPHTVTLRTATLHTHITRTTLTTLTTLTTRTTPTHPTRITLPHHTHHPRHPHHHHRHPPCHRHTPHRHRHRRCRHRLRHLHHHRHPRHRHPLPFRPAVRANAG